MNTIRERLKNVTVDMILLVFCSFIAAGSVIAAVAVYVTPHVDAASDFQESIQTGAVEGTVDFAQSLEGTTNAMHEGIDALVESEEVLPEEPEPITIRTTRSDVIVDSYEDDVDYSSLMAECATAARDSDDPDTYLALGEIYEAKRNLKILTTGSEYETTDYFGADKTLKEIVHIYYPPYYPYTEYEVQRLAALIYGEAGSWFVSDAHQRDVASVVVNRAYSNRFPDTWDIVSVIQAPGQYPGTRDLRYYTDREYANALYVLENGPTTTGVFQANFKQGPVVAVYDYTDYGWAPLTFICE